MSRSQIGPGNRDKAWNDPPQLAFNASNTSQPSSNRLRMMKKRVPVPINALNSSLVAPSQEKPLPLNPLPFHIPPKDEELKQKEKGAEEEKEIMNSEELLTKVENSLSEILGLYENTLETSAKEDITRRLNILKEMWLQDKLNNEVKRQMKLLTTALGEKNYDLAWSVHQSLIVNYTGDCSKWMIGIKALITEARKKRLTDRETGTDKSSTETKDEHTTSEMPVFMNPKNESNSDS